MKYQSIQLRQALASEYVLGTLTPRARKRFQRLLAQDASLRADVRTWEERFSGAVVYPPVVPRDVVWSGIQLRLLQDTAKVVPITAAPSPKPPNVALWRSWAGLATAASVVLGVLLVRQLRIPPPPIPEPRIVTVRVEVPVPVNVNVPVPVQAYVAAVRLPNEEAQWTVSLLPDARSLRVSANAAAKLGKEQDYELWWLDDTGVTSLGLLPRDGVAQTTLPAGVHPRAGGKVAISLEPSGGSTTGKGPSGPVLVASAVVSSI